jgi:hypothetical protein
MKNSSDTNWNRTRDLPARDLCLHGVKIGSLCQYVADANDTDFGKSQVQIAQRNAVDILDTCG